MTTRLLDGPRVHGRWTRAWWAGDPALLELFGPAPSRTSLRTHVPKIPRRSGWTGILRGQPTSEDSLLVLAGQQPVLAGGPLLVAHKIATAIAVARHLQDSCECPVVPVFLVATQDHDSDEVDHIDFIEPLKRSLLRLRCNMHPRHEMFVRAAWNEAGLRHVEDTLKGYYSYFPHLSNNLRVSAHVEQLILEAFGPLGLRVVDAADVGRLAPQVLEKALTRPEAPRASLSTGGRAMSDLGLQAPLDAEDTRPLVLESRDGRRRRLPPDDQDALVRLRAGPADFSPHAALRPIVQAAALPVVAQVCGPSEILYLGQARGLHDLFGVQPPLLVPRLEATRLFPDDVHATETSEAALDEAARLLSPDEPDDPTSQALAALERAADGLVDAVTATDPALSGRAHRLRTQLVKRARRLAQAPSFRTSLPSGARDRLLPRGRPQDAVLAWAPEAWRDGDPVAWARHIVSLCRIDEPPRHVLHLGPQPDAGPPASAARPNRPA